jgi:hypothetical protein
VSDYIARMRDKQRIKAVLRFETVSRPTRFGTLDK